MSKVILNKNLPLALFLSLLFLNIGCSTLSLKYTEPLEANSFMVNAPSEEVFNKIKSLLQDAGYKLDQENLTDYLVLDRTVDFVGDLDGRLSQKNKMTRVYLRYIFIITKNGDHQCTVYIRGLVGTKDFNNRPENYSVLDYIRRTIMIWGQEVQEFYENKPIEPTF